MNNIYWSIYLRLEKEILNTTHIVRYDDNQLSVYSELYAELLIRTAVEIEAISKELYLNNGGPCIPIEDEMYFDTKCLKYLNEIWNLEEKEIYVTGSGFYFENEENKVLHPLKKSYKRGSSGSDWKKAYQAVKHNRSKNFKMANAKNCLRALGALYILNIYYKNTKYIIGNQTNLEKFDSTLGSNIFSINYYISRHLNLEKKYPSNSIYILRNSDDFCKKYYEASKKMSYALFERLTKDSAFATAVAVGKINPTDLKDVNTLIDVLGKESFGKYYSESGRISGVSDLIMNTDYVGIINK